MNSKTVRNICLIAAASALVACAIRPWHSNRVAATPAGGATAAADPKDPNAGPRGYKRVTRGGKEFLCKDERVTGSHMLNEQVCFTPEQLKAQTDTAQEFLRRTENSSTYPAVQVGGGK